MNWFIDYITRTTRRYTRQLRRDKRSAMQTAVRNVAYHHFRAAHYRQQISKLEDRINEAERTCDQHRTTMQTLNPDKADKFDRTVLGIH